MDPWMQGSREVGVFFGERVVSQGTKGVVLGGGGWG